MNNLWAPWRMEYITRPKEHEEHEKHKSSDCVFCVPFKEISSDKKTTTSDFAGDSTSDSTGNPISEFPNDAQKLIIYRKNHCYVMLNRYPYAAGHLLILPYRHIMDITDLSLEESQELMELTQLSCKVLRKECKAEGINVGVNLGEAAGAGIVGHLHYHVVPRWKGDSQFISVLAEVRLIPEHLIKTQERFAISFKSLAN